MDIVNKIKDLCKQKQITITELERLVGIGRSTIRNWDKSYPTTDKLQKIADYFHVSVDYLLGREDNQHTLTEKDEKDIAKTMAKMKEQLLKDSGLMFDGEVLDKETIQLLLEEIERQERIVKAVNKKYIPKKYR